MGPISLDGAAGHPGGTKDGKPCPGMFWLLDEPWWPPVMKKYGSQGSEVEIAAFGKQCRETRIQGGLTFVELFRTLYPRVRIGLSGFSTSRRM